MTARARARAAVDRVPLPAETLVGVLVGVLLQRARPWVLQVGTRPVGAMCAVGGLALVVAAVRERGPGSLEEPATLVTTGLHGVSRNPMYVGCTAVQLGLGGVARSGWMLAASPASAALLHLAVLREERWLGERFGTAYDSYRAEVPRYL